METDQVMAATFPPTTVVPDTTLKTKLRLNVFDAKNTPLDFTGYLDTGADENVISSELADLLGYPIEAWDGGNFIAAGKNNVTPKGQINMLFQWKKSPTEKLHKEIFLVADMPYDIILGKPFLDKNQVYEFSGKLLPLALKPPSDEEQASMELEEQHRKAQQKLEEGEEIRQRKEGRENERARKLSSQTRGPRGEVGTVSGVAA